MLHVVSDMLRSAAQRSSGGGRRGSRGACPVSVALTVRAFPRDALAPTEVRSFHVFAARSVQLSAEATQENNTWNFSTGDYLGPEPGVVYM